MQFSTIEGETHILLEDGEDGNQVLRCIVRASYDLAEPKGLSVLGYEPDHKLSEEDLGTIIRPPRSQDGMVVDMHFTYGRECRTTIYWLDTSYLVLYYKYFSRYRGSPNPMLELAQALLASQSSA